MLLLLIGFFGFTRRMRQIRIGNRSLPAPRRVRVKSDWIEPPFTSCATTRDTFEGDHRSARATSAFEDAPSAIEVFERMGFTPQPTSGDQHAVAVLLTGVSVRQTKLQQLRIAREGCEQIREVVGDLASHAAGGLQSLRAE